MMILGTGIHLISADCDDNRTLFTLDDMVTVKKRNYLVESGYTEYTGRIDSILVNTNEIRLDISSTSDSKYVVIGFGQIMSIEKYIDPETGLSDDDPVVFDVKAKRMLMEVIPGLLQEILIKLATIQANCAKYHEE